MVVEGVAVEEEGGRWRRCLGVAVMVAGWWWLDWRGREGGEGFRGGATDRVRVVGGVINLNPRGRVGHAVAWLERNGG